MRTTIKILAWLLGIVVLAAVAVVVVVALFVDPNEYRRDIADLVSRHTGLHRSPQTMSHWPSTYMHSGAQSSPQLRVPPGQPASAALEESGRGPSEGRGLSAGLLSGGQAGSPAVSKEQAPRRRHAGNNARGATFNNITSS